MGVYEQLDFTNEETLSEAAGKAEKLGMTKAFKENQGTGFVLVFNKSNPDKWEKLKNSTDTAEYEALFKKMN